MHCKTLALVLVTTLSAAATAQTGTPAKVETPTSSAPVVVANAAPTRPVAAQTEVHTAAQTVYTPQLPSVAELTSAASAQGLTLERVVQTSSQIIAFYRNASGQTNTVAYQTLPPTVVAAPAPAPVVSTQQTVVYRTAPRVIYYDDYPSYYYPRVWYPPVSFSLGFGYRSGFYHGGFHHGGYHRWR